MRIIIKGGVWKNTEDEILKAAVMKYGKNQWARVASLLSRKTANQCKARWYEWLDPSVKKTEWNKEEEEKLLHLAKLMPNQWRTIAPIVGRTAGQCMEHYERLLDQAQEGITSSEHDDPRRLKQGEIDPAPESKPARPDPIDMDEDEKEMLSEARARLANTKGKKAKRKARERQLEESRRLSVLQKRRELKAAGIESKIGMGSKRNINYAKEIPFQKVPPAGFYDVSEEIRLGKSQHLDVGSQGIDIAIMEGRHAKAEEEREKQREAKRLKMLFKANAPQAVSQIEEINDPTALRRRVSLNLPEPQVSDTELEDIVKLSQTGASLMGPPEGGGSLRGLNATLALVGNYTTSLLENRATPLRTPIQENAILQEARNLRILRDMTPLLDGQNDVELPELQGGFGFEGVAPKMSKLSTPNTVLGTPMNSIYGAVESDASSTRGGGSSSKWGARPASVLRDQFGLNNFSGGDTASVTSASVADSQLTFASKIRDKQLRALISSQLKSLPEPEYTYDIAIPELEKDEDDGAGAIKGRAQDAAEALAEQEELRAEEARRELARRSAVIRRGLPRPSDCSITLMKSRGISDPSDAIAVGLKGGIDASSLATASALVNEEMIRLMAHDSYKFPDMSSQNQKARPRPVHIAELDDSLIESARDLISKELASMGVGGLSGGSSCPPEPFTSMWEELYKGLLYFHSSVSEKPQSSASALTVSGSKQEIMSSTKNQFSVLSSAVEKLDKRGAKLESKLQVTHQGYMLRSCKLNERMVEVLSEYQSVSIELASYEMLRDNEERAAFRRRKRALSELHSAEQLELELQDRFRRAQEKYKLKNVV